MNRSFAALALIASAAAGCAGVAPGSSEVTASDAPFDCSQTHPAPDASAAPLPTQLACTGLYADWASKTIDTSVQGYAPAASLWADGADKSRWIQLPPGTQIGTTNPDEWIFPAGTKLWKEFRLSGKRIETRMLWKTASGWTFAVYRWSDDESSAPLLLDGEPNVEGTSYEVPAVSQCATCHEGRKDRVLGFEAVGLGLAGAQGLTLARLSDAHQLTDPPASTTVTIPEDGTGKAGAALAWLHANCGNACHNANPAARASWTGFRAKLLWNQLQGPASGLDTVTTAVNVAFLNPERQSWMLSRPAIPRAASSRRWT